MDWLLGIMLAFLFLGILCAIVPYFCIMVSEIIVLIDEYFRYKDLQKVVDKLRKS
jgi:hypothetical protein